MIMWLFFPRAVCSCPAWAFQPDPTYILHVEMWLEVRGGGAELWLLTELAHFRVRVWWWQAISQGTRELNGCSEQGLKVLASHISD